MGLRSRRKGKQQLDEQEISEHENGGIGDLYKASKEEEFFKWLRKIKNPLQLQWVY